MSDRFLILLGRDNNRISIAKSQVVSILDPNKDRPHWIIIAGGCDALYEVPSSIENGRTINNFLRELE